QLGVVDRKRAKRKRRLFHASSKKLLLRAKATMHIGDVDTCQAADVPQAGLVIGQAGKAPLGGYKNSLTGRRGAGFVKGSRHSCSAFQLVMQPGPTPVINR